MSGNDGAGPSNTGDEQAVDVNMVSFWQLSQQMSDEDTYVDQDSGGDHEHDSGDDEPTTGVGEDDTTTNGGERTDDGDRIDGGAHPDGGASDDPSAKKKKKDMKD